MQRFGHGSHTILAIEAELEADVTTALAHALHLGLFVRTPIN
jgi:hypothetical protein